MTADRSAALRFGVLAAGLGFAAIGVVSATRAGWSIDALRGVVAAAGVWGPLAYLSAAAVLPLVWVPRLGLVTLAGALFGGPLGAVLGSLGGLLGVALGYAVARRLGADYVLGRPGAGRVVGLIETHGVPLVILGRVCPVIPCEGVSLACGLLAMPVRRYLAASAAAIVPTSALYAAMGASAAEHQGVLATTLAGVNAAIALAAVVGLGRFAVRPR
ncbi:MAG: VTT domain-containing protein [Myxococcota bacterium]